MSHFFEKPKREKGNICTAGKEMKAEEHKQERHFCIKILISRFSVILDRNESKAFIHSTNAYTVKPRFNESRFNVKSRFKK